MDREEENLRLYKCLADRSRLRLLSSLTQAPMYVELLAQRLELTPATVSFHLKKLEEAGLVTLKKEQYYTVAEIRKDSLTKTILSTLQPGEDQAAAEEAREEAYRRKVLASFMKYGRLTAIPVQRKKQRIILEELLRSFEPGRVYEEKEVNEILSGFHEDFCTLRRMMICEGLMTRDHGQYRVETQE